MESRSKPQKSKKKRKRSRDTEQSNNGRCINVSERYEKLGRIGEGTYGIVYKARDKQTNEIVALKKCLPHHESSDGFPLTTLREIHSLRICQHHPNIVHLQDIAVSSHAVFLVFEYCPHDLSRLVDAHYQSHSKSPFSQAQTKRLVYQLLSALDFMHSRHLIHRDIKLSNLLLSTDGSLRLADFGLSRKVLLPHLTPKVVSLWYRPPELLLGSEIYTTAVDLWAAGCVMGELLKGVPLVDGRNELDQISKIFQLLGPPNVSQWPELVDMPLIRDGRVELSAKSSRSDGKSLLDRFSHLSATGIGFLAKLLSYDHHKRGSAKEALQSSYFTELPSMTSTTTMPRFSNRKL